MSYRREIANRYTQVYLFDDEKKPLILLMPAKLNGEPLEVTETWLTIDEFEQLVEDTRHAIANLDNLR